MAEILQGFSIIAVWSVTFFTAVYPQEVKEFLTFKAIETKHDVFAAAILWLFVLSAIRGVFYLLELFA